MLDKTIAEKLGLTQDATPEVLARALGVYKIIDSKESYTDLLKNKLKKEFETTNTLIKKVADLESAAKTSNKLNETLKKNLTRSLEHI
ncbi:MAG: hypothetical protein LBD41_08125 [Clostridiales Family XIII bacterium]|jgi:hypothetical protein|nr:hypothetical protein [Clostridiales Family XIII bacterium]